MGRSSSSSIATTHDHSHYQTPLVCTKCMSLGKLRFLYSVEVISKRDGKPIKQYYDYYDDRKHVHYQPHNNKVKSKEIML